MITSGVASSEAPPHHVAERCPLLQSLRHHPVFSVLVVGSELTVRVSATGKQAPEGWDLLASQLNLHVWISVGLSKCLMNELSLSQMTLLPQQVNDWSS